MLYIVAFSFNCAATLEVSPASKWIVPTKSNFISFAIRFLVANLFQVYHYTGTGQERDIINLGIPKEKKIKFAFLVCPTYAVNGVRGSDIAIVHSVMLDGYNKSKYANIDIASFNQDNTLNVTMVSYGTEQIIPRTNLIYEYSILVFF